MKMYKKKKFKANLWFLMAFISPFTAVIGYNLCWFDVFFISCAAMAVAWFAIGLHFMNKVSDAFSSGTSPFDDYGYC